MLEITQTQRYYHFVVLRGAARRIRSRFFDDQNIQKGNLFKVSADCTARLLRVTSDFPYYRGSEDFSINGRLVLDGVLFDHKALNVMMLGFPFKRLMNDMAHRLATDYGIVAGGNFVKVDMGKLILANEGETELSIDGNQFFLAGVNLTVSGDSYLSTVKLAGDKPLDSELYKVYFKPRVHDNKSRLERCTMKCKVVSNSDLENTRMVSSIHIDKFGNYKLYVHSQGRNLTALPAIFEFLDSIECLADTPYTPTEHILDDEDDEI
jgi:hypothetical protein